MIRENCDLGFIILICNLSNFLNKINDKGDWEIELAEKEDEQEELIIALQAEFEEK